MNIVFAFATENYPLSFSANNSKISLTSKYLASLGCRVTIINNAKYCQSEYDYLESGVRIINIKKNSQTFKKINQILKDVYIENDKNYIILSCGTFPNHIQFFIKGKRLGYKVGYIFQEWHWDLEDNIRGKVNAVLCEKILIRKFDFILPISEFLIDKIRTYKIPYYKFPIIAEFPATISSDCSEDKFVYCAHVGYRRALSFILESFSLLLQTHDCKLSLILNGPIAEIDKVRTTVTNLGLDENCCIFTHLPFDKLQKEFSEASGLLIPLIPNYNPDIARFSQKTAEYLATGNPVVTTSVGEMIHYFENKKNIYMSGFDPNEYAGTCRDILDNPSDARKIGIEGFLYGKSMFDVSVVVNGLYNFLNNLM